MELLYLASLAPAGVEKKVANLIEIYAPWMQPDEAEALIQHLSLIPNYQKLRTAEELGRMLHLTNADRERLKLWRIRPFDMTAEQLAKQTRDRDRGDEEAYRAVRVRTGWEAREVVFA